MANTALQYFINKEWMFVNKKSLELRNKLKKEDYDEFYVEVEVNYLKYFRNAALGGKKYLMKEDLNDLDKDRRRIFQ